MTMTRTGSPWRRPLPPASPASTGRSASTSNASARTGSIVTSKRSSASDLGALLLFDTSNIRYVTATQIGYWACNKGERYALLTRTGRPGSRLRLGGQGAPPAAPPPVRRDELRRREDGLQGAIHPRVGLQARAVQEIKSIMAEEGVGDMPLGVDVAETSIFLELMKAGIEVRDGQQVMADAREIKSPDEIMLLTQACAMVDGVYQDIFEALKPGVRESDIVALAHARLFEMGSEFVEAINSIAGERCSPHPHVFSDRMIRPGDRRTSTSSTSSTATGRATTARSWSAGRRRRSATRSRARASGWTPRSTS